MKKCGRCKQLKKESEFNKDRTTKDGLCSKCKTCRKKYYNPLSARNTNLKRYYGISLEDYKIIYDLQDGKCAICGIEKLLYGTTKTDSLHVDHDHKTGKVRSLLCQNCNLGLGLLKENKQTLKNMLKYIGVD